MALLDTLHKKGTPSLHESVEKKSENLAIFFWTQVN